MNIVVTGSLGYDYIMDFSGRFSDRMMMDKIHKISLSFLVDTLTKQMGGTAGNIAYSLKLLGVEPLLLTCAGNDFDPYEKHLKTHDISTRYIVKKDDVASGTYFVMTDKDDNQIGGYYKGVSQYNKDLSMKTIKKPIDLAVISANDPMAMKQYVRDCVSLHIPYMYDPAFQIGDFTPKELEVAISHAAMCIGNDYEIALIEKRLGITHDALRELVPILITTLGAKGSCIETERKTYHIQAARVAKTTDPTGAGDAYRSGFLSGFVRGYDYQVCGQMGSIAAAYTVELYGTQTHAYTKKEFCTRYTKTYTTKIVL